MNLLDKVLMYIFILIGKRFFDWLDVERSDDGEDVLALYFYNADNNSPMKFFAGLTNEERHSVLIDAAYCEQGFPSCPERENTLNDKLDKYIYPNE